LYARSNDAHGAEAVHGAASLPDGETRNVAAPAGSDASSVAQATISAKV
jgi:hypothetical protein